MKKKKIIALVLLVIALILSYSFWVVHFHRIVTDPTISNDVFFTYIKERTYLGIFLLCITTPLVCLSAYWFKNKKIISNVILFLGIIYIFIVGGEIIFMHIPKSDGVGTTYAHQLWARTYWGQGMTLTAETQQGVINTYLRIPIDTLGQGDFCPKPKVFFIGDSFTAGDGINDYANTFVGIYTKKHPELVVIPLGERGADTYKARHNFLAGLFLLQKKYQCENIAGIIWQYGYNDIDVTARQYGLKMEDIPYNFLQKNGEKYLMESSFLGDYIYWRFFHPKRDTYSEFLHTAFNNEEVISTHLQPLFLTAAEARQQDIPFTVILFPMLIDIEQSQKDYALIYQILEQNKIPYIDVGSLIQDIPVNKRIVNGRNLHPSLLVHQRVGEMLK